MCAFVVDFAAKHDCFAANARADDRHGKRPQPFRKHLRQKSSRKFDVQHLKIPNPPTSGTVWRLSLSSFRVTATGSPLRICMVNNGEQSAIQMLIPVNSRQVKNKEGFTYCESHVFVRTDEGEQCASVARRHALLRCRSDGSLARHPEWYESSDTVGSAGKSFVHNPRSRAGKHRPV